MFDLSFCGQKLFQFGNVLRDSESQFDHLVKGEKEAQSEFGMEMQRNEVSGRMPTRPKLVALDH